MLSVFYLLFQKKALISNISFLQETCIILSLFQFSQMSLDEFLDIYSREQVKKHTEKEVLFALSS